MGGLDNKIFMFSTCSLDYYLQPSFPRDGGRPNRGGNTALQKTASHRLPCLAYHNGKL